MQVLRGLHLPYYLAYGSSANTIRILLMHRHVVRHSTPRNRSIVQCKAVPSPSENKALPWRRAEYVPKITEMSRDSAGLGPKSPSADRWSPRGILIGPCALH